MSEELKEIREALEIIQKAIDNGEQDYGSDYVGGDPVILPTISIKITEDEAEFIDQALASLDALMKTHAVVLREPR